MAGVAALPGDSMRVALSNMSGVWIEHFAVLDRCATSRQRWTRRAGWP